MASSRHVPHISGSGRNDEQTFGRSGEPNILHRFFSSKLTHRTPAGFPLGMPGIGDEIDSAIQHAPHPARHSIDDTPDIGTLPYPAQITPRIISTIPNSIYPRLFLHLS